MQDIVPSIIQTKCTTESWILNTGNLMAFTSFLKLNAVLWLVNYGLFTWLIAGFEAEGAHTIQTRSQTTNN